MPGINLPTCLWAQKTCLFTFVFILLTATTLASTSITTNVTKYNAGDWVEVSWDYNESNYSDCWIGLFAPIDTPKMTTIKPEGGVSSQPYVSTAPIKYIFCNQGGGMTTGKGQFNFHLTNNYRQDVFFAIFEGGLATPTEVTRTTAIVAENPNAPMHLRLSLTKNVGEMMVGWTAKLPTTNLIEYGYSKDNLSNKGIAEYSETYGREDLCGAPGSGSGWFEPGYAFYAIIPPLTKDDVKECFYRVGSDESGWSEIQSFTQESPETLNAPHKQVKILLTADVGATELDGSHYHWEEPNASSTYRLMAGAKTGADLAVHIGDLAYATGYESKWENFMHQIEDISASMPYMVGLGNHERDYPNTGSTGGTDSGGECGVATRHRFRMPSPDPDSDQFWYSFDISGLVHMVMLNSEVPMGVGSEQYIFLDEDLQNVNRTNTPWVVVMYHRAMYFAYQGVGYNVYGDGVQNFDEVEALLIKHGVDLCLSGHVHNLMVTCPVNNGKCVKQGEAPVHIVVGNGGQDLSFYPNKTEVPKVPEWVDYKLANFGWNELLVNNYGKELVVNMYSDKDDSLYHSVKLEK